MAVVLQRLGAELLEQNIPPGCDESSMLVDSLPIVTWLKAGGMAK